MLWVIIGLAASVIFAVCAVLLIAAERRPVRADECRPGYQEVIVRDAVDVLTQQYVSGDGAYFPNVDGMQSTPTVVPEDSAGGWCIVFRDMSTGKAYRKKVGGNLILGRDPATRCGEARLMIADGLVSKNHCMIRCDRDSVSIKDLDSKNGTYLNGSRICESVPLNSGDVLGMGNTSMEVQVIKEKNN